MLHYSDIRNQIMKLSDTEQQIKFQQNFYAEW